MKTIDFKKYHQAKERAKARARFLMDAMQKDNTYVFIPPEVDPFAGNLEEEITKVLYESDLANGYGRD